MKSVLPRLWFILLAALSLMVPTSLLATGQGELSKGQTIYAPAYSHIYSGNREKPFLLTVTLSIRNIDPRHPITINLIDYYETQGKLLKKCIDKPFQLGPLESFRYIIPEKDESGGSGANFMVEWNSTENSNPPIIETIMIGTQFQQGISFTSRGQAIVTE